MNGALFCMAAQTPPFSQNESRQVVSEHSPSDEVMVEERWAEHERAIGNHALSLGKGISFWWLAQQQHNRSTLAFPAFCLEPHPDHFETGVYS